MIDIEDFSNFFGKNKIFLKRYTSILEDLKRGYEGLGNSGLNSGLVKSDGKNNNANGGFQVGDLPLEYLVEKLIGISAAVEEEAQDGDAFECARKIAEEKRKAKEEKEGSAKRNTKGKGKSESSKAGGMKGKGYAALKEDSSDSSSSSSSSDTDSDSGSEMRIEETAVDWSDREGNSIERIITDCHYVRSNN